MIGTDEMSSTGMDISESFRPEDISKTDFFDFVTAPDMGIGIGVGVGVGVGVSLHSHHHHHHHSHQHTHSHDRNTTTSGMTHDGGGGSSGSGGSTGGGSAIRGDNNINNDNTSDPTLQAYEFWHSDKEQSRLESTIFEDLDRYCWQQQQSATQQHHSPAPQHHTTSPTSPTSNQQQQQQLVRAQHVSCNSSASPNNNSTNSNTNNINSGCQTDSNGNVSTIENTDGQIYTITVLNGNEPWLKREPDTTQLPSTLDLDSLLGNFPSYIKSEYPYDDSGFSTDGTKDLNGDVNGISSISTHHSMNTISSGQSLPSLATALSISGGGSGGGGGSSNGTSNATSLGQQLAQFQNNNNDWHMVDHNAEQNSAESLLRSALQGKGYTKGLHMQNGITLLPSSPSVKDDDMRRILFPSDADSLAFADSSLNAAHIFEDTQNASHNPHMLVPQHAQQTANGSLTNANTNSSSVGVPSIIVDDMFLSLENAFSDDFEKIKRIANEVQQFCTTTPTTSDYVGTNDVMMQISPTAAAAQLQHSPTTTPTGISSAQQTAPQQSGATSIMRMQSVGKTLGTQPPPQPLKSEVTTSTSRITTTSGATGGVTKTTKKYKRSTSMTHNNNNNNPNVINHNSSTNSACSNNNNGGNGTTTVNNNVTNHTIANTSNCSGSSSSNSSNSPTHCNGQRKERSLHYCSICSKGFKDKYSVNVHIRTHTGEKPFACSLCGKSFRQKAHLAKHYQTHMAQKNNGSIVKGASAKPHRSNANVTATTPTTSCVNNNSTAAVVAAQHRQLSAIPTTVTLSGSVGSSSIGNGSATGSVGGMGIIGATSSNIGGMTMPNGPTSTAVPTTTAVLSSANGLLSSR